MARDLSQGAGAPGHGTPLKNEAPGVTAGGWKAQTGSGRTPILAQAEAADKAFNTLRARAALAGQTLERVDPRDGGPVFYRVGRWGLCRSLPDLQSVEAFLERVGAPR